MSNSINLQMTALANAVRNKANILSKLTIANMITILSGLNLTGSDITLGEIDLNGNFQPLTFYGSKASISGSPISISNYYTWNNISQYVPFEELSESLTLIAVENNSTVILSGIGSPVVSGLQYRTNTNTTWTNYLINTPITLSNTNDYVQFKNNSKQLSRSSTNYAQFVMSGKIKAFGNIQSMLNYSNSCTNYCYYNMFRGCTSLISAPTLPATTLANQCYMDMFQGCSSLSSAPTLPATTLFSNCYYNMFYGCSSLSSINVSFTDWNFNIFPTSNWLSNVASSGTFTKPTSLEPLSGASNIPNNWTVINK